MGIEQLLEANGGERKGKSPFRQQNPEALKEAFQTLSEENTFRPGDLVEWKPGMQNRRTSGPFIVVKVLDEPVFGGEEHESSGHPLFREPLDIVCGLIATDGEFLCLHCDSRRFRHYISDVDAPAQ